MAGMAGDLDPEPAGAVDRGDHADRQLQLLEHRALLDMHLDIAQHGVTPPADRRDRRRVAAEAAQRSLEMGALGVDHVQRLRVERAGDRARAGELAREAHAFLVAERDHLDRERQTLAGAVQRRHGLDRGDHAEIAVVVPGVAHRVDVRAQQQRRQSRTVALVAADHVGGGVELDRHPGLLHPAADHRVAAAWAGVR